MQFVSKDGRKWATEVQYAPITVEQFKLLRLNIRKKFEEYITQHPDWEIGFVPRTLSDWFSTDVGGPHFKGLDGIMFSYALYLETKVRDSDDQEWEKLPHLYPESVKAKRSLPTIVSI